MQILVKGQFSNTASFAYAILIHGSHHDGGFDLELVHEVEATQLLHQNGVK